MKKKLIIICSFILVVLSVVGFLIFGGEKGIEINETNFPEKTVREIAIKADKNRSGVLSEKEADGVKEIYLKKLLPQDVADIYEFEALPSYTDADFTFDFKGIEHFKAATMLTVDLADGEYFNKESDREEIYVKTANIENIYKLKNLKTVYFYEVELKEIDITGFESLAKLNLHNMYNMEELVFPTHSELKEVWITDSGRLKNVDFSRLSNIKKAHIRYNGNVKSVKFSESNSSLKTISLCGLPRLNTVDLSLCKGLEILSVSETPLNALNVSNNKKLKYIDLTKMNLKAIDLSQNNEIIEILNEDAAQKIKVSDDNKIEWVRWINSDIKEFSLDNLNPETLVGIDIVGTKIKKLDISRYYKLETVYYDRETTTVIGDKSGVAD